MRRPRTIAALLAAAITLGAATLANAVAVDDKTATPGKAAMTPQELALLDRLNVWMGDYDTDPRKMCEEVYAEDANVWVPNNGIWYRTRSTWTNYEVANFKAQGGKRNTHLTVAYVRDNIAVIEATGWAATLYFDPVTQRIFTDRTYITGRANPAKAADLDALPLISAGSLPPVTPDKANLRYGAIELRDGMKFGNERTRAMGLKIFGAGSLTPEEAANVAAVQRRAELYNTAPDKMVDQVYANDFKRMLIKFGPPPTIHDKAAFKAFEAGVRQTFPGVRTQITTIVPRGDTVAYESVTSFTKDHEEWSLTVARFKAGKIVEEHVYESTAFDPDSSVGKLLKQATT